MGCDVIGDVHGQHRKLAAPLAMLGYRVRRGAYRHPEGRMAVFVGDLIDRGPGQVEALEIARRMRDAGSAAVVMGNHELNAIGYATRGEDGTWLREHSLKNASQHGAFLAAVGEGSALHADWVDWFRSLPAALDLGGIRVCHAWWDEARVAAVGRAGDAAGRLREDYLRSAFVEGEDAHDALEGLTKGLEVALPEGEAFTDHNGARREMVRLRWWDDDATTYRRAAIVPDAERGGLPDVALPPGLPPGNPSDVPVFVGHYWMTGKAKVQKSNTAVLDYGAGLGGPLVAYRWEGERELDNDRMVWVQ